MRTVPLACLFLALSAAAPVAAQQSPYLHAPSVDTYAKFDPEGVTTLPDGRLIHPLGHSLPLAEWPHGLALSPDGDTLFVASEGVGQLIAHWTDPQPTVTQLIPLSGRDGKRRANAGGAA